MKNTILIAIIITIALVSCKRFTEEYKIDPHDLLSDVKYKKLTVEVQSFKGWEPTENTLKKLQEFLEARLNKPDGIQLISTSIDPPRNERYSLEDIRKLEDKYRTRYSSRDHASVYFLFIDGEYAANAGNSVTLGVAYGSGSMVIFEESISKYSGGLTQPPRSSLETAVSIHELGHILGLVNNGTAMTTGHEDQAHIKHCDNKDCIMFWEAETSDFLANFTGTVPSLDSNCIKDLQRNGGR